MRAANRSLAAMIAFLFSVIAVPAYAADDTPGLLDAVGKTVESVTKPVLAPKPATTAAAPSAAGPVAQLTSVVDSALGGRTSLSQTSLVSTVDNLLVGTTPPSQAPAETPSDGPDLTAPVVPEATATLTDRAAREDTVASSTYEAVMHLSSFSASTDSAEAETVATEIAHIPGTSTLPDGGSPLTLTWLVLAVGLSAVGATIIRRARMR